MVSSLEFGCRLHVVGMLAVNQHPAGFLPLSLMHIHFFLSRSLYLSLSLSLSPSPSLACCRTPRRSYPGELQRCINTIEHILVGCRWFIQTDSIRAYMTLQQLQEECSLPDRIERGKALAPGSHHC